jgi:hypothetical protein
VDEQVQTAEVIAADNGGQGFQFAVEPEARKKLWEARHNAWFVEACTHLPETQPPPQVRFSGHAAGLSRVQH